MKFTFAAVAVILAIGVLCSAADIRPDLHGDVLSAKGHQPLPGARVFIYTAGPKTGTTTYCPGCYADCAKSATTDATGSFVIGALDPTLIFRVLVIAPGFRPAFVEHVDPAAKPISVTLEPQEKQSDPARTVSGKIVDNAGKPIAGATVSVTDWNALHCEPLQITDAGGGYSFTTSKPTSPQDYAWLKVYARGFATGAFAQPAKVPGIHKLQTGATVNGRVLRNGKPMANVEVGLVQQDRGTNFTGECTTTTDRDGRYAFYNVGPEGLWYACVHMSSLQPSEAVPFVPVTVTGDDTTVTVADLATAPAFTVAGRVVLSDNHPLPAGTRVQLDREDVWDSQIVTADANGGFTFHGVPAEHVTISVRVNGYHFSQFNPNLNLLNGNFIEGRAASDLHGLIILLDPGAWKLPKYTNAEATATDTLKTRPLEGVETHLSNE